MLANNYNIINNTFQLDNSSWDKLSENGKHTIISKLFGHFNQDFSFPKAPLKAIHLKVGKQCHICFTNMTDKQIKLFQHEIIAFEAFQARCQVSMANSEAGFQNSDDHIDETTENIDLAVYVTKQKKDMKLTANQLFLSQVISAVC